MLTIVNIDNYLVHLHDPPTATHQLAAADPPEQEDRDDRRQTHVPNLSKGVFPELSGPNSSEGLPVQAAISCGRVLPRLKETLRPVVLELATSQNAVIAPASSLGAASSAQGLGAGTRSCCRTGSTARADRTAAASSPIEPPAAIKNSAADPRVPGDGVR